MWTRHDFHYQLPPELIAQVPLPERRASRLLVLDKSDQQSVIQDKHFTDLLEYLKPGDRLVFNNTRVIPARIHGLKDTGGKVELLLERCLSNSEALVHLRASKSPKPGSQLIFEQNCAVSVLDKTGALYKVRFYRDILEYLHAYGHMPLPPYIEREDNELDQSRYQTVFAKNPGAVAAPTASLHFDESMLQDIRSQGVDISELTLHVGAGTFQPVRVDDLSQHVMHSEWLDVPQSVVDEIMQTRQQGGRIIAVGTTVVRSLETAARGGDLQSFQGDSDLFITPGFEFQVVDAMLTNFHLPESTLLMLVSAFAGHANIKHAYAHAIAAKYRFFSYGDAMLLLNRASETA
ncbi:MAG: tRNA preQ1(34) S-adenosylmethionine ribosyltransferase-isomerase QueA [Gammaproteobacteria bacterium]|nr:tRNA preQ1(34) S-adenosylmethionine ribosyltransferase-isomerase QueA [Gammaproteobacteria bacterium]NNC96691.1 tRNA preQ1(34) S-adenosylmethionine ribosyltransferase-isomerase QueA [Gammaproteobacteria bacterium]NNM13805.1 tRNA preQ1(34) S-adenosylmethionine ribosyltransferase-isomerase QueA [Gammaproteobacteria bacterium]